MGETKEEMVKIFITMKDNKTMNLVMDFNELTYTVEDDSDFLYLYGDDGNVTLINKSEIKILTTKNNI